MKTKKGFFGGLSIQTKVTLLLMALALLLAMATLAYFYLQNHQLKIYLESKKESDRTVITKVLDFKAESVLNSTIDNAVWDDAIRFLQTGDTVWAEENFGTSIITFGLDFFNVYDIDGNLFYTAKTEEAPELHIQPERIISWFEGTGAIRTFVFENSKLFEIYGSAIVPSWDLDYTTKANGYLLTIKYWDAEYIGEIEKSTGFSIRIIEPGTQYTANTDRKKEVVMVPLFDANENKVCQLVFSREDQLHYSLEKVRFITLIGYILFVGLILIYIYLTHKLITVPLKSIAAGLQNSATGPITHLLHQKDEFGEIADLIVKFNDQKVRLLSEIQMRKNATDKFRTLLEAQPDTMFLTDHSGDIIDFYAPDNHWLEKVFGKINDRNIREILPEQVWKEFGGLMTRLYQSNKVQAVEFELSPYKFEARIALTSQDQVLYIIRNITEQRQIEEEAGKIRHLLEQTNKVARIGSWELLAGMKTGYWSKETCRIFDVEDNFVPTYLTTIRFFTKRESRNQIIQTVNHSINTGESFDVEEEITTRQGIAKWIRITGNAVTSSGKVERVYGIVQDISKQKNAAIQLSLSEKNLKELNAAKDQFFSIIAHDLKNPFNGIKGFGGLLIEDAEKLSAIEVKSYAGFIVQAANQALSLLENLLDWARTQQGKLLFMPKRLLLHDLITETMAFIGDAAITKNIAVQNKVDHNLIARADEDMLKTIMRNLLSNAVKFTGNNGKVEVSAQRHDGDILVTVSDNGVGISKKKIEKLFDLSSQFTTQGTSNETGTGLGLILCKEFVEKHGGKIWVESEEGRGTSFTFSLPVAT